jgi:hypothetical protein
MGIKDGEAWRMCDNSGTISLIPLPCMGDYDEYAEMIEGVFEEEATKGCINNCF